MTGAEVVTSGAVEVVVGRSGVVLSVLSGGAIFGITFGSRMATIVPFQRVESELRATVVRAGSSRSKPATRKKRHAQE